MAAWWEKAWFTITPDSWQSEGLKENVKRGFLNGLNTDSYDSKREAFDALVEAEKSLGKDGKSSLEKLSQDLNFNDDTKASFIKMLKNPRAVDYLIAANKTGGAQITLSAENKAKLVYTEADAANDKTGSIKQGAAVPGSQTILQEGFAMMADPAVFKNADDFKNQDKIKATFEQATKDFVTSKDSNQVHVLAFLQKNSASARKIMPALEASAAFRKAVFDGLNKSDEFWAWSIDDKQGAAVVDPAEQAKMNRVLATPIGTLAYKRALETARTVTGYDYTNKLAGEVKAEMTDAIKHYVVNNSTNPMVHLKGFIEANDPAEFKRISPHLNTLEKSPHAVRAIRVSLSYNDEITAESIRDAVKKGTQAYLTSPSVAPGAAIKTMQELAPHPLLGEMAKYPKVAAAFKSALKNDGFWAEISSADKAQQDAALGTVDAKKLLALESGRAALIQSFYTLGKSDTYTRSSFQKSVTQTAVKSFGQTLAGMDPSKPEAIYKEIKAGVKLMDPDGSKGFAGVLSALEAGNQNTPGLLGAFALAMRDQDFRGYLETRLEGADGAKSLLSKDQLEKMLKAGHGKYIKGLLEQVHENPDLKIARHFGEIEGRVKDLNKVVDERDANEKRIKDIDKTVKDLDKKIKERERKLGTVGAGKDGEARYAALTREKEGFEKQRKTLQAEKEGLERKNEALEAVIMTKMTKVGEALRGAGVAVDINIDPEMILGFLKELFTGNVSGAINGLMAGLKAAGMDPNAVAALGDMLGPMSGFLAFMVEPYAKFYQVHGERLFAGAKNLYEQTTKVVAGIRGEKARGTKAYADREAEERAAAAESERNKTALNKATTSGINVSAAQKEAAAPATKPTTTGAGKLTPVTSIPLAGSTAVVGGAGTPVKQAAATTIGKGGAPQKPRHMLPRHPDQVFSKMHTDIVGLRIPGLNVNSGMLKGDFYSSLNQYDGPDNILNGVEARKFAASAEFDAAAKEFTQKLRLDAENSKLVKNTLKGSVLQMN